MLDVPNPEPALANWSRLDPKRSDIFTYRGAQLLRYVRNVLLLLVIISMGVCSGDPHVGNLYTCKLDLIEYWLAGVLIWQGLMDPHRLPKLIVTYRAESREVGRLYDSA
jgi:hypothetical protein